MDERDGDSKTSREQIRDARKRGDVVALIAGLEDPRAAPLAARYLGELRAREAAPALIPLLDSPVRLQRATSARALGRLRATEAHPRLREMAVDVLAPLLDDRSGRVCSGAVLGLGQLGYRTALEPLRATRSRLWRRPIRWWWRRGLFDDTIEALERGTIPRKSPRI